MLDMDMAGYYHKEVTTPVQYMCVNSGHCITIPNVPALFHVNVHCCV